jgi:enoyl-CoA hydratase/carnithine racemase
LITARARRWEGLILECSPMSVRASKQAITQDFDRPILKKAINTTYPAVQDLYVSADFVEGPKAFAEKRAPNWSGS